MFATSIGGTATGHGGDRVLLDDPHNVEEAESDDVRESVIEAWKKTFSTRLNDPKTGAFVVIMQRLHARDLTGYLLARGGRLDAPVPPDGVREEALRGLRRATRARKRASCSARNGSGRRRSRR
jgi:hypothetical protein